MFIVLLRPTLAYPRLVWPELGTSSALFALIVISTAIRLVWAACLEASNDEAYNFLYTVYPDWSQFDHPPATMIIEQIGLALFGGAVTPLSLRIGFVLLGSASTWLLARWTTTIFNDARAGFYAAFAMNATGLFAVKVGSFALPDGPVTFFALATLAALSSAFAQAPRLKPWILVGICWGLSLASKYHAIFLPAGALLFAALAPQARCHLRSPGPYLAVLIGLMGCLPALLWNANNHWASFAYQGGRAVGWAFRPTKLLQFVGEQMLVWLPWIWFPLVLIMLRRLHAWRTLGMVERQLLCQAVVPLGFFLTVATLRGGMPHWSWIGFLPLFPLLGRAWSLEASGDPLRVRRRMMVLGVLVVVVLAAILLYVRSGWFPAKLRDPSRDFSGWESVGHELAARGLLDQPKTFLFTNEWFASGHLGFETDGKVPVLCYRSDDARGFAHWSAPQQWLGYDGLLIDHSHEPGLIEHYAPYFRSYEVVATFPMTRGGQPMRPIRVVRYREQILPYPFKSHSHELLK